MPSKSTTIAITQSRTKTASTTNAPARRRAASRVKDANNGITSESIAADLAAFRKEGGRIDVLGTTPIRRQVRGTAFRSRNSERKAPTMPAAISATKG